MDQSIIFSDCLLQKAVLSSKIKFGSNAFCPLAKLHLLVLSFVVLLANTGSANTIWQGDISNDWHTPGNWSADVPDANDEVIIPAVALPNLSPTITSTAVAKEVGISLGGSLIIATGGSLAISGSTGIGLDIYGSVENNGTLSINNTAFDGMLLRTGSTFTNKGTLNIGDIANIGYSGLKNEGGTFVNESGTISINRSGAAASSTAGITNQASFTNKATISIGGLAAGLNAGSGLWNQGAPASFTNQAGATISIDRTPSYGLRNTINGTMTNQGFINIGVVGSINGYGVYNTATFSNSSGTLSIDKATQAALYNFSGTFTNSAMLSLKTDVAAPFLVNSAAGTITNSATGTLSGTGVINPTHFTNAGGILSPGYSPGIMTFSGDENFSNSTMAIEVNGTGVAGTSYDQVVVNGTATLGGTLALTFNFPNPNSGDAVKILDATSLTGTFSTVTGLPTGWIVNYNEVNPGEITLSYLVALPVNLVRFSAKKQDNFVKLDWQTASEVDKPGLWYRTQT